MTNTLFVFLFTYSPACRNCSHWWCQSIHFTFTPRYTDFRTVRYVCTFSKNKLFLKNWNRVKIFLVDLLKLLTFGRRWWFRFVIAIVNRACAPEWVTAVFWLIDSKRRAREKAQRDCITRRAHRSSSLIWCNGNMLIRYNCVGKIKSTSVFNHRRRFDSRVEILKWRITKSFLY